MITREQAITADVFHDDTAYNSDGTCCRWRRNGSTQTWKTRPGQFRIPVKYGLRGYGSITHNNANSVHTREDCTNPKGKGY